MAFDQIGLDVIASSKGGLNIVTYETADIAATVQTANYFDGSILANMKIKKGDIIFVHSDVGGSELTTIHRFTTLVASPSDVVISTTGTPIV